MRKLILNLILLILAGVTFSQSTEGVDFWFGYMSNLVAPSHEVYISSRKNASGTIEVPGLAFSQAFTVAANTTTQIILPAGVETPNEGLANLAVHVAACDSITVYSVSGGSASADATVVFPTSSLGSEYYILNVNGNPADFGDEFLVVATQDSTIVEITPTVTSDGGQAANVPFTITLNEGEMYQMFNNSGSENFSYTKIESSSGSGNCAPVAVFAGSKCINIGGCGACDHLYEQLLPVTALGTEYILIPHEEKSSTWYRVMAIENGTTLSLNGGAPINLNAGDVHEFNSNLEYYLTSNNPVSVMQYAQGLQCSDPTGDPMAIQIFPIDQVIENITFNCFATPLVNNYWTNIVVETANVGGVILDGNNVSGNFNPVPSNPTYSFAQINLAQGNHTLNAPGGALVTVYGWGNAESFGYCAGASIKNLVDDFTFNPNGACAGTVVNFQAINDPLALSYSWDFGDGSPLATGINTTHQFPYEDNFKVTLIKEKNTSCNTTISKNVTVVSPPIQMDLSDTSFCEPTLLSLSVSGDTSYQVEIITGCDTSFVTVTADYDSIYWSTGDTGENITVNVLSDTVIHVFGYKNGESCVATDSIVVTIDEIQLDFNTPIVCEGDSIQLIASAITNVDSLTYVWGMGDMVGNEMGDTISYLYAASGNYSVELTATAPGGCQVSVIKDVQINAIPTANFNFQSVCEGVNFEPIDSSYTTTGTINSWYWDFQNDSIVDDSIQNPQYLYSDTGNYSVSLTVVSNGGCSDTIIKSINVYPLPNPIFTATNACKNTSVTFTNLTAGGVNQSYWDYTSDGVIDDSIASPTYTYENPGTFPVNLLIVDQNGCANDTTITVEIYENPVADFTFDTVCLGEQTSFIDQSIGGVINQWNWDIEVVDPVIQNPIHIFSNFGTFQVALEVTNTNGCIDDTVKTVVVNAPPVVDYSYIGVCQNELFNFTNLTTQQGGGAPTNYSYTWDFGDMSLSSLENPSHKYTQPGQYSVTLTATSSAGCTDFETKTIDVFEVPIASFISNEVCFNEVTSLSDQSSIQTGSIVNYEWFIEGNTLNTQDVNYTFAQPGLTNVQLKVISDNGCVDSINQDVFVYSLPIADFSYSPEEIDIFETYVCFSNESFLGDVFLWDFDFQNQQSVNEFPCVQFPYLENESYDVSLFIQTVNGCTDSIIKTITVSEGFLLYVPNSFTPDGDGKNDIFQPIYSGVTDVELLIFNRWGEEIFRSDRLNASWDGSYKGVLSKEDTYIFKISGVDILNRKFKKVGHVNLLK